MRTRRLGRNNKNVGDWWLYMQQVHRVQHQSTIRPKGYFTNRHYERVPSDMEDTQQCHRHASGSSLGTHNMECDGPMRASAALFVQETAAPVCAQNTAKYTSARTRHRVKTQHHKHQACQFSAAAGQLHIRIIW